MVKKPKGVLRDVIDLRPVNQFMLASAHPLSDVEKIQAEISGYSCKGEFDLKAAYFQQAISELDSKRLAVRGVDRILLPDCPWGPRTLGPSSSDRRMMPSNCMGENGSASLRLEKLNATCRPRSKETTCTWWGIPGSTSPGPSDEPLT